MRRMSKEQFIDRKKSDTLVILGSGYSINKIKDWDKIKKFDSIAFNWFCNHKFVPNFFLIREQSNIKSRVNKNETIERFYNVLSQDSYKNTCMIVQDLKHSKKANIHMSKTDLLSQEGVVLNDVRCLRRPDFNSDIFKKGVIHYRCTLSNVLHIGVFLRYDRIIFAGVDLYDSRYFWLPPKSTRKNIKRKGLIFKNKHPITSSVLKTVSYAKQCGNVRMYTLNHKSLLKRKIECISEGDL